MQHRPAAPILRPISRSIVPSLANKTPRYLNSFTWGKDSFPTRSRHSTGFLLRVMASDLEVLTLIPAASHSAANRSRLVTKRSPGGGQPHLERIRLTAEDTDTAHALSVQRLDGPEKRPSPHTPAAPSTKIPGYPVIRLLQIHKTHVDWMGILPGPLQDLASKELVRGSPARTKTALFLFQSEVRLLAEPPFQHFGVHFTRRLRSVIPL
ncbi:hypothetical protein DPEC_G00106830 [Dallia pectoralis]|uniref:Uncharacterized protein n=1 Tax=Dallia pectoralis TaxID=75939 RepID=A0ACC2GY83_DALPE|nr:hypothetical protein DPEC_G00106830 [Dallia pectoralis]